MVGVGEYLYLSLSHDHSLIVWSMAYTDNRCTSWIMIAVCIATIAGIVIRIACKYSLSTVFYGVLSCIL